jgi:hypothetical protein
MESQANHKSNQMQPQSGVAIELEGLRNHFSHSAFSSESVATYPIEDTLRDRRSPLPLDSGFVQQTKDQIRQIVDSIAKLAQTPIEPTLFVSSALTKIVQAMGANCAMLWQRTLDSDWILIGNRSAPEDLLQVRKEESAFEQFDFIESQLRAASSESSSESPLPPSQADAPIEVLRSLLDAVSRERQPILVPPRQVSLDSARPANPTDDIVMFAPLALPREQGEYWLQVHQPATGGPSSQRGYLRFVAQMADLLSDFFKSHRLKLLEHDRNFMALVEKTLCDLSSDASPQRGMARLMTAIRQHANSDHAFLLRKPGKLGRWRVVAAAGLTEIDRKATGIEQVELVAPILQRMNPHGGVCRPSGDDQNMVQPHLREFASLFASSETAWVKCLDLSTDLAASQNQDIAVLLVWSGEQQHSVNWFRQCSLLARLGLSALQLPWWRKVRQMRSNKKSSYFPNPLLGWSSQIRWGVASILLACILAIPVPIHIHAPAVLVPTVQQHVYAPWDSIVDSILVDHGQHVKQGEPLLRLKSPILQAEFDAAQSSQRRNTQRLADIEGRLLRETNLPKAQRDELEGELCMLQSTQEIEQRSIRRLERQLESLTVIAQFDGTVATWNAQVNLKDRPVRAGQWLLSLHEVEAQWMFEAALPEQYAGEFQDAIEAGSSDAIAMLTSAPKHPIHIRYNRTEIPYIDLSSQYFDPKFASRGYSEMAILRLRFDVEDGLIPEKIATAGTTARVSVTSGKGPLIWAFSKDFLRKTWAQIRLWI